MVGTWALEHLGTRHLGTWALGQVLDARMDAAADGKRVNDTLCVADIIITIITIIVIIIIIVQTYLIFVIFFTQSKFLENKIYTENRVN